MAVVVLDTEVDNIQVWNVSTENYTKKYSLNGINGVFITLSCDNHDLFAFSLSTRYIAVWNITSWTKVFISNTLPSSVQSFSFDNKGILAGGSYDGIITLWDCSSWQVLNYLNVTDQVQSLIFDNHGLLASGTRNGLINIWNATSGLLHMKVVNCTYSIICLSFDNQGLLAGGLETEIKVWNVTGDKAVEIKTMAGHHGSVSRISFVNQGLLVSATRLGEIKMWNVTSGLLLETLTEHEIKLNASELYSSVSVDSKGSFATWSISDSTLNVWKENV